MDPLHILLMSRTALIYQLASLKDLPLLWWRLGTTHSLWVLVTGESVTTLVSDWLWLWLTVNSVFLFYSGTFGVQTYWWSLWSQLLLNQWDDRSSVCVSEPETRWQNWPIHSQSTGKNDLLKSRHRMHACWDYGYNDKVNITPTPSTVCVSI